MPQEIDDVFEALSTNKGDLVGQQTQAQATHAAEVELVRAAIADLQADLRSLQKLYARALDAQATAERIRDATRTECQGLLEENRLLRRNR